jgi:hypothetical protein
VQAADLALTATTWKSDNLQANHPHRDTEVAIMTRVARFPRIAATMLLPAAFLLIAGCRMNSYSSDPSGRLSLLRPPEEAPRIKEEHLKAFGEPLPTGIRPVTPEDAQALAFQNTAPGTLTGGAPGAAIATGSRPGDTPPPPPPPTDPYVAELLGILKETKSVDAFITTLGLLVEAKADHHLAVPAVIRNAERLGVFADHIRKDDGEAMEVIELVTTAIDKLLGRTSGTRGGPGKVAPSPASGSQTRPLPNKCAALALAAALRCVNPWSVGIFTPVPVAPWVTERIEEQLANPSTHTTPILPPIAPGYRPPCDQPPDRAEILRALRQNGSIPPVYQQSRDDFEIVIEKLVDKVDPPRFYPLVGPAQLHRCHWKCTVYFNETVKSTYPFPFETKRRRSEVVYIDKDQLHLAVPAPGAAQSVNRDVTDERP